MYVLSLDIGTSGIRAGIFDQNAKLIPKSLTVKKLSVKFIPNGQVSLNPSEVLSKIEEIIDEVLLKTKEFEISAVGISCFWHSLVGINEKGKTTTDLILWADTRSQHKVRKLKQSLDESQFHNLTGARFHSSFWTAKLLWLQEEEPTVFNKTSKWLSLPDLLIKTFCGEIATSISIASGTGIFDIRSLKWASEILKFLRLSRDKLPEIVNSNVTFQLKENYANRWKKLKEARWLPAIGDGAANNLGLNCTDESKAVLMIGSSAAVRVLFTGGPPEKIPKGLWCYCLDEGRTITGGALSEGGLLYNWLRENLKAQKADFLPDSHGLIFLPFLAGERSTGYKFDSGAIFGLRITTTASEILQAGLEAIAYRLAAIFEQLQQVFEIQQIVANGKALWDSKTWAQIISDVLGKDIKLSYQKEASLKGAAIFALEKTEGFIPTEKLRAKTIYPDVENHRTYQIARKKHEKLYRTLRELDQNT